MLKHQGVINILSAIDDKWRHVVDKHKRENPSYDTEHEEKIRYDIQEAIKTLTKED